MTTTTNPTAFDATDREIVISRDFDAPRELVWEAWTKPEHIAKWWGPRGFSTTIEEMDVRPGGVWKQVMHGPDGADYPNKSLFTEVVKPARICFRHGGGRKGNQGVTFESTWTFDHLGDNKSRVTIRMVFATKEDRDRVVKDYGAIEGGHQTLARLAEHLATLR
ncbi:MAG: SRPBCC family protein [Methylacidiphilales bacterium]|nr:SRPBCC family protein [Candidatus Methylacidiphilales bacterium]